MRLVMATEAKREQILEPVVGRIPVYVVHLERIGRIAFLAPVLVSLERS
jgi:hypothetical protein